MKPVLSVEHLTKKIGGRTIVDDISFTVNPGEIFGFLGPNGAGKTTTIRMLVGLIKPTSGSIVIGGHNLQTHFLEAIKQVGCIVENPELYPYLTGRENLEHFARMIDNIDDDRIDEVVRLVELEKRIDETVKTYSLGMRQRLGIAQALLGNPQLLILDEPTNGLDPAGIRELRAFIRRLAQEQSISIFISSHILYEIQLLCERVAIISHGKVLKTAAVSQLVGDDSKVEWSLNPIPQAIKQFSELPYIRNVEQLGKESVMVHMPVEKIAETNQLLLASNIQVSAIRPMNQTLEDIFLEMTGGEGIG
ncbi:ABC transporter ATP-binding protein [Shimazuella sp. AN120528]|uniref:ABC transporter ATP-binding protein n=1 Tax=Shimazuella soli TaxID=1892854 RepID=UPI001F0E02C9|nr:ABC transporter ATP-binding protein [Shimazuella soli]MCH5584112.1 ABC transporter ATP-binding protein [Shimazuella soli]